MTILIGVNHTDGIVMGSDRLEITDPGYAENDAQKLYWGRNYVGGYRGDMPSEDWDFLDNTNKSIVMEGDSNDIIRFNGAFYKNLCPRRRIPAANIPVFGPLCKPARQKNVHVNQMLFSAPLGIYNGENFVLYRDSVFKRNIQEYRTMIIANHALSCPEWQNLDHYKDRDSAVEFVASVIRHYSEKYPADYRGLHVVSLTADGANEMIREPAIT